MPPLSRWFVKAGFVSLALALVAERGSVPAAWAAFALFQCGLGLAVVGHAFPADGSVPTVGRWLLVLAAFTFVWLLWGRVKPFAAR
jgi:ABC-type uncharacterized transport system permease subunit